jgi:hypothetical protein
MCGRFQASRAPMEVPCWFKTTARRRTSANATTPRRGLPGAGNRLPCIKPARVRNM